MDAVRTASTLRRSRRRRTLPVIQEALFEVQLRPERRYYRQIVDALRRSAFGADGHDSECVISKLFGAVWAGQDGRDGAVEEAFGVGLVEYARELRTPFAVALLRTVAAIAPILQVRDAAARAADALIDSGLPDPRWTRPVGTATAGRCWVFEDIFGDHSSLICEFGHEPPVGSAAFGPEDSSERHAIVMYVDHAAFSVATDCMLINDVDPFIRDMRNDAKHSDARFTLRQVDPAWARGLLARAFARTDLIDGVEVEPTFADLRALALARVRALPDDPAALPSEPMSPAAEARRALLDEFMASPEGSALANSGSAESVARLIVTYSSHYDPGEPARVGPSKWEVFVLDWLPRRAELAEAERAALPAVMRAWSVWAGRRANLPAAAAADLGAALEGLLEDANLLVHTEVDTT